MKRFSKNDNSAICNYCGKWQPTNLTNQQLEEMDWKCAECKAKEPKQPQAIPTEQDPGDEEISKYHPAYEFLIKLVKVISQAVPEAIPEIKQLAESKPFHTVADVEYLTTQIWTLATEKYHIPREWLIKKLPKNASLKTAADEPRCTCGCSLKDHYFAGTPEEFCKYCAPDCMKYTPKTDKKADLWPSQEQAGDMLSHEHNSLSYNNEQEADTSVSGPNPNDVNDDALWDIVVNEFFTAHKQWSEVVKAIQLAHPEVTPEALTALKDRARQSVDDQMGMIGSKDQTKVADGEFKGSEFSGTDDAPNPLTDIGPWSSPEDHGKKPQKSPFPNTNWLPADDENLDQQAPSNVAASSLNRPFSKKANPNSHYWIAPDGTEFDAGTHHGAWIKVNKDLLSKQYGIKNPNLTYVIDEMYKNGWVRVSNEPAGDGFQIQVQDMNRMPAFLDNFISQHFTEGDYIQIGDQSGHYVEIDNPFPSIQKAINRQLKHASLKQAAISGEITNKILQTIHNNGGVTYNLTQGDMAGTPNYSVSVYPDRERIVDGVDFDVLEGFIQDNEDLLRDPNNSIGSWSNNGKVYLDIFITTPDQEKAIDLAKQNNQIAIWDLQNGREISTGGTGGSNKAAAPVDMFETTFGPDIKVLRNPTLAEAMALFKNSKWKNLRWGTSDPDVWMWDAYDLDHAPAAQALGLEDFERRGEISSPEEIQKVLQKYLQVRAFSKKNLIKTAEESLLSQIDQNQIAAASSPAYVIAVNNYAEALKRGHSKDRSLEYAIESVQNLEKVDPKKLVEFINTYVPN